MKSLQPLASIFSWLVALSLASTVWALLPEEYNQKVLATPAHSLTSSGPFCSSTTSSTNRTTFTLPNDLSDYSFEQLPTEHGPFWWPGHIQVQGEVQVTTETTGSAEAGQGITTTVDVQVSSDSLIDLLSFEETSSGIIVRTAAPPSSFLGGLNPCISLLVTVTVPSDAALESFNVLTQALSTRFLSSFGTPPNHTRIMSETGSVHAPGEAPLESRRTIIDIATGSITGTYVLRDVLFLRTRTGSIDVTVEPESVTEPPSAPAVLEVHSQTGAVKVEVAAPLQSSKADYRTVVSTTTGSISGTFLLGPLTSLSTETGSLKVCFLVPPNAHDKISLPLQLYTTTRTGQIEVTISALPSSSLSKLRSKHGSTNGAVSIRYPSLWSGSLSAKSTTGIVDVKGNGLEFDRDRGPPGFEHYVRAHKGEGISDMTVETVTGSVNVLVE